MIKYDEENDPLKKEMIEERNLFLKRLKKQAVREQEEGLDDREPREDYEDNSPPILTEQEADEQGFSLSSSVMAKRVKVSSVTLRSYTTEGLPAAMVNGYFRFREADIPLAIEIRDEKKKRMLGGVKVDEDADSEEEN